MKIYYIDHLVGISGWGSETRVPFSPFFNSEEKAITWAKENNISLLSNGYCYDYSIVETEVL